MSRRSKETKFRPEKIQANRSEEIRLVLPGFSIDLRDKNLIGLFFPTDFGPFRPTQNGPFCPPLTRWEDSLKIGYIPTANKLFWHQRVSLFLLQIKFHSVNTSRPQNLMHRYRQQSQDREVHLQNPLIHQLSILFCFQN